MNTVYLVKVIYKIAIFKESNHVAVTNAKPWWSSRNARQKTWRPTKGKTEQENWWRLPKLDGGKTTLRSFGACMKYLNVNKSGSYINTNVAFRANEINSSFICAWNRLQRFVYIAKLNLHVCILYVWSSCHCCYFCRICGVRPKNNFSSTNYLLLTIYDACWAQFYVTCMVQSFTYFK